MKKTRVFVAGHQGMVGSALVKLLASRSDLELVVRSRAELDLSNQQLVSEFFQENAIAQVYLAAAKVGGIQANSSYPADFIYENLMIQCNVIHAAHVANINQLLFLGSSCIYPKITEQPISESALLTGELEPTNEPYAIAKIAGIKLCEAYNRQYARQYRSIMPTNLYGENDNFHPTNSHVIPALIARFHQAKVSNASTISIWGSGNAQREFLHVNDLAAAAIHVMELPEQTYNAHTQPTVSHLNIGTGKDCTIKELAQTLASIIGYQGEIVFDQSKPDGTPKKCLNVSRMHALGWQHKISLEQGLADTYQWYLNQETLRHS
ncbi:GDP-L-fucose synthase [Colwellia asteriadis]|uniref:GDP-L-fucose synthase n=1 Tax=Colwellia asteriadis TaxID=517723 RepID=A0ABP3WET5_9GAMM